MRAWTEQLFYGLSAVVLGAALFVLQPANNSDLAKFQANIKDQVSVATVQVFGDQPVFSGVDLIVGSINEFYNQSADAFLALLAPTPGEEDMSRVAQNVYAQIVVMFDQNSIQQPQVAGVQIEAPPAVPDNFMQEEPLYNIVPELPSAPPSPYFETPFRKKITQSAASFTPAVNDGGGAWVNLRDEVTGQIYCVAIYNSEINRYLGPCKNDYH
jgi:hypothetical protein